MMPMLSGNCPDTAVAKREDMIRAHFKKILAKIARKTLISAFYGLNSEYPPQLYFEQRG